MASIFSVVFFAGCRFRILLLFSASAYFQLCLPRVPLIGSLASLPFCLGSLLLSPLSLLRLFPLPGSSPLVLRAFSCLVFFCRSSSLVASSSPPYIGLLWFLFIFFVTRSNLSSFAMGSSLWAELSHIISLSTARRVGMLQAVAAEISSPGEVCVFVFSS